MLTRDQPVNAHHGNVHCYSCVHPCRCFCVHPHINVIAQGADNPQQQHCILQHLNTGQQIQHGTTAQTLHNVQYPRRCFMTCVQTAIQAETCKQGVSGLTFSVATSPGASLVCTLESSNLSPVSPPPLDQVLHTFQAVLTCNTSAVIHSCHCQTCHVKVDRCWVKV